MFNTNTNNKNSWVTYGVLKFRFKKKDIILKKYAYLGNKKRPEFFIDTDAAKKQNIDLKKIKLNKTFYHYQSAGAYFYMDKKFMKLEFFLHYLISQQKGNDLLIKMIVTKIDLELDRLNNKFPNYIKLNFLSINDEVIKGKMQAEDSFSMHEKDRKLNELIYSNNYDIFKNTHESNSNFPFSPNIIFEDYWSKNNYILFYYNNINKNNYIDFYNLFYNDVQAKRRMECYLANKDLILAYDSISKTDLKTKMVIDDTFIRSTLALHILFKKKEFFLEQVSLLRLYHNIIALNEKIIEIA